MFLLFYGFCSCLRKSIFVVSEPFLLRKKSPVWESALPPHSEVTVVASLSRAWQVGMFLLNDVVRSNPIFSALPRQVG